MCNLWESLVFLYYLRQCLLTSLHVNYIRKKVITCILRKKVITCICRRALSHSFCPGADVVQILKRWLILSVTALKVRNVKSKLLELQVIATLFLPIHETPADTTQCNLLDVVQSLRSQHISQLMLATIRMSVLIIFTVF